MKRSEIMAEFRNVRTARRALTNLSVAEVVRREPPKKRRFAVKITQLLLPIQYQAPVDVPEENRVRRPRRKKLWTQLCVSPEQPPEPVL